jgi:hypothetical protein
MESSRPTEESVPWWGAVSLEPKTGGRWEVGPSTLWLYRTAREWRVLHRPTADPETTDPMANRSNVTVPLPEDDMASVLEAADDDLHVSRHSFRRTEAQVTLQPALADRPVVSRPEHPLFVPPDESVTLYLSTAVWIRIELGDSERLLQEVSSYRMSDTWFGASTVDGEFCYATRTAGRLQLEKLPRRLHRAVTPLRIKNSAEDALALERVQLPVEHLALYATPTNMLWTQAVTMTHAEGREGAGVQIRSGPPSDAGGAKLLQDPRKTDKKGLFTSTFSAVGTLFGS